MPLPDWAPTVADVGALLRSRTKDTNGNELGTFTADTRPTDGQVTAIIATVAGDVETLAADAALPETPLVLYGSAKQLAVLATAMQVELSYFPEQVAQGRSPYDQLKALYDDRLDRYTKALASVGTGGDVGGAADPVGAFPDYTIISFEAGQW